MPSRLLAQYFFAAILCIATLSVRLLLQQFIELKRPLTILFLIPVLLTAYYGGGRLGAFTTVFSAMLMSMFVTGHQSVGAEISYLGLFMIMGLLISIVCERLRQSREALRATVEQLELAASAAQLGVLDHDLLTDKIQLSPQLREIAGLSPTEEYSFEQWLGLVHLDDVETVRQKIESMRMPGQSETFALRRRLVRPSGKTIWVDVWARVLFDTASGSPKPTRSVLVYKDVSEEVRREKSLAEAQRFEYLGRITGEIAHNFSNILTIISGNLQIFRSQSTQTTKFIDEAILATGMGERLVDRLVRIARRRPLTKSHIAVNASIGALLELVLPPLKPKVECEASLLAAPDTISVDVAEFEAALVNFLENAVDAMPDGGIVKINTMNSTYEQPVQWVGGILSAGNYIEITVADTGHGMDELTLSRCMEPFFTSKAELGTGLGLSTAVSFAAQSGGMLSIKSAVGEGTTVCLTLPLRTPHDP